MAWEIGWEGFLSLKLESNGGDGILMGPKIWGGPAPCCAQERGKDPRVSQLCGLLEASPSSLSQKSSEKAEFPEASGSLARGDQWGPSLVSGHHPNSAGKNSRRQRKEKTPGVSGLESATNQ